MYVDSAASDHFAPLNIPFPNKQKIQSLNPIFLTNGDTMTATHKVIIPTLDSISTKNKTCQLCPDNVGTTLVSLEKLCDNDCVAVVDKEKCMIFKGKSTVMKANRCANTGMHVTNL